MSMRADGLDDLIGDLTKASVAAKLGGQESAKRVGRKIEQTAKSLAPKGPRPHGEEDLAPSIHMTEEPDGAVEIGPSARHGGFVERGTYKDPPQPYMGPSSDRHAPEFVKDIERLGGDI